MKTIVIVGLRIRQEGRVLAEVGKEARLVFVEGRGDRARIPRGDHCILTVGTVRHLWTDRAHEAFPRSRVHYVRGGVGDVVRTVRELT